jgi:hypothetical protein
MNDGGIDLPDDEKADFLPCILSERQGRFSILYVAFDDEFVRRAQTHKGQGGGYSLEAMVDAALEIEGLELPDLKPASEADMFAMRGEKSSLMVVARIVRRLLVDSEYAEAAIARSRANGAFD